MRKIHSGIFILIIFALIANLSYAENRFALVIHGGAGNIPKESLTENDIERYEAKLALALKVGEEMLINGAEALTVAIEVVKILEDSPLFNAGKGAVFNIEGKNELDASIMCGKTKNAGAVAAITTVKNPIEAAYKVMTNSPHVMLIGKGAELFSYEQGLEIVEPSYFFDQRRWDQMKDAIRRSQGSLDTEDPYEKMGTVGAVVMDINGNFAAATSTGGMTAKRYGRVGDSPIIGAGTYADNNVGAVSATGHGEFFIRHVIAYDIIARMKYAEASLEEAAQELIMNILTEYPANGGIIALDKDGNPAMVFNTTAMFRGFINSEGDVMVGIFAD